MRENRTSGLMSGEGKRSGYRLPPRPSSTLLANEFSRLAKASEDAGESE